MRLDKLTRDAIAHTLHCLLGCSIGEVLGMVVAETLGWHNVAQTILAISLAFLFGYILTYSSFVRSGVRGKEAVKATLATDTVSIATMELVDNAFIWFIPAAIHATLSMWLFWWSMGLGLVIAFMITVPVNRFMMKRGIGYGHHQH